MPYKVVSFESTPNPNAIKCVLDRSPTERPRSYFNAEAAEGDPLAEALFGIEGVTNILIHTQWISVSKAPETTWAGVKAEVRRVLQEAD